MQEVLPTYRADMRFRSLRPRGTRTGERLAYPRLGRWSLLALPLNVVLALVVLLFVPGAEGKRRWCAGILTLVCGVYAFIPSLVFRD